jgi:hypothetical protein
MSYRTLLCARWHERALVTRKSLFGESDEKLRPVAVPSQVDVPVPGTVGPAYERGGLAIVSVNPAGGRDGFRPTAGDAELYRAAETFREVGDLQAFERMADAYLTGMPNWGAQWRIISDLLQTTRTSLEQLSYPYLVPFRSRGDQGSRLPRTVLEMGYNLGFPSILEALQPGLVIAVDRPSERACERVRAESGLRFDLVYYTRQRDAHAARSATLRELAQRSS